MLAEHGGAILFREESRKARTEGFDTQAMLDQLVEAVAILACCPGGVTVFGYHGAAEDVRQDWGLVRPAPLPQAEGEDPPASEGMVPDPAHALPVLRAIGRLEMRWFDRPLGPLEALLPIAVLDRVRAWQAQGALTEEQLRRLRAALPDLEQRGDDLFRLQRGASRQRFDQLAHALAVLAFLPAGVTAFGMSFCSRAQSTQEDASPGGGA
ncbi:MAG TPA: hypothetical protein VFV38_39355 [Ktedonobacteraceae bacterium]|nr:hypothetical protein [Ktedonobacteraceae bacterium]